MVAFLLGYVLNFDVFRDLVFKDYVVNVFVESHGLLFDLIFFGVIFTVQQAYSEKRKEKRRLARDIDNIRGWNDQEAMIRLKSIVKEISEELLSNFTFNDCYFKGIRLRYAYFQNAFLGNCDFSNSFLPGSSFDGADLNHCNMSEALLNNSSFRYANIDEAKFHNAKIEGVEFSETILHSHKLNEHDLVKLKQIDKLQLIEIGNRRMRRIFGAEGAIVSRISEKYKVCVRFHPYTRLLDRSEQKTGTLYWVLMKKEEQEPALILSRMEVIRFAIKKYYKMKKWKREFRSSSVNKVNVEARVSLTEVSEISQLLNSTGNV